MLTVHKRLVTMAPQQFFPLPMGAEILAVSLLHGSPYLSYRCDAEEVTETRALRCCGARQPTRVGRFISTVRMFDGAQTWHYFEGE